MASVESFYNRQASALTFAMFFGGLSMGAWHLEKTLSGEIVSGLIFRRRGARCCLEVGSIVFLDRSDRLGGGFLAICGAL